MSAQIIDCRWFMEAARLDAAPRASRVAEIKAFPVAAVVRLFGPIGGLNSIAALTTNPRAFAREMETKARHAAALLRFSPTEQRNAMHRADLWGAYAAMIEAEPPAAWRDRRAKHLRNAVTFSGG